MSFRRKEILESISYLIFVIKCSYVVEYVMAAFILVFIAL
jgi:hypothetical protein